jgi:spermidine synthase
MKRLLGFGFLLMGFTFTVTQGLMIRELIVAFFGNELSIGLILGNWLILEAVGSGLLGRLADRWGDKPGSFATLQVLFALFLPLCLFGAYSSRIIIGAIPGEGMGLIPIFWSSFLILTPLALVDGAMFTFGSRAFATLTDRKVPSIGQVYVLEALGAIVGGIVFTYVFIPFLYSVQIVLVLSALNLLSAVLLFLWTNQSITRLRTSKILPIILLITLGLVVSLALSPWSQMVQRWASGQQWTELDLVYYENSVYGNVAVVQQESQYTFYADGIPIVTAPVPDLVLSEEMVHLPMSFISQADRALVLSGGVGGVINELIKYPFQVIDYAELDPLLIQAVEEFPTSLTRHELSDPRLQTEHIDGRLLVRQKTESTIAPYDLVILNLPYPSTLQLNRFYTLEFFKMVRELMSEDGILVITCPGTLTYMSAELRDLNLMAYHTLKEVMPHVRPIPGDHTLWMASQANELSAVPVETVVERWEGRNLESRLITTDHIHLKLSEMRLNWFWGALGEFLKEGKVTVNRDLHPTGLYYGLAYWHALFSPQLMGLFEYASKVNLWILSLPILGASLLYFASMKLTGRGRRAVIPIAIATTGFTGMMADLVLIFAFQSLFGYIYHWIGLFITAFMAGLSLGGLLMTRRLTRIKRARWILLKLELAIMLFWILVPIILYTLYTNNANQIVFTGTQGILLLLNATGGYLVGSQFPLANRLLLKDQETSKGSTGILYASDLVGAFLGSILISVVLIPVLGILQTCIFAVIIKLGSSFLVTALPPSSQG